MTRRTILQAALPLAAPQQGPQRFGGSNQPQCPVCRTPVPADAPAYLPVIVNAADGTTAKLPNLRMYICSQCGVFFAVSK